MILSNAETELTSAAGSGNIYWNVFGGLPPREDIRQKRLLRLPKNGGI